MYGDYVKERLGRDYIEILGKGFATWELGEDYCYIVDIYVNPDFRKENIASQMADAIAERAKMAGKNKLIGSVAPTANGSTDSVKVLLAYGFELLSSENNMIYFQKEI